MAPMLVDYFNDDEEAKLRVVPANAGTHTPWRLLFKQSWI
jgi:hypothetical protein